MSFTYTKEGIKLTKRMKNPAWKFVHFMFHEYCFYRGWGMKSEEYQSLFSHIYNAFDVFDGCIVLKIEILYEWFINFLQSFDEINLTEIDLYKLKKILQKFKRSNNEKI